MTRRIYLTTLLVLWLLLLVGPVAAAEGELAANAVILPGWVGGILAVIALILPISLRLWLRRR